MRWVSTASIVQNVARICIISDTILHVAICINFVAYQPARYMQTLMNPTYYRITKKNTIKQENPSRNMRGFRGGGTGGLDSPSEKSQNIGFPSNTGPDPLKNHKATSHQLQC